VITKFHSRATALQFQVVSLDVMMIPTLIALSLTVLLFGFESSSPERTKSI
jgi:hypothetical protein